MIDLVFRTGTVNVTSDFEVIVNTIREIALEETAPETVLCGDCEKKYRTGAIMAVILGVPVIWACVLSTFGGSVDGPNDGEFLCGFGSPQVSPH